MAVPLNTADADGLPDAEEMVTLRQIEDEVSDDAEWNVYLQFAG